jgi:hypothetical protein
MIGASRSVEALRLHGTLNVLLCLLTSIETTVYRELVEVVAIHLLREESLIWILPSTKV